MAKSEGFGKLPIGVANAEPHQHGYSSRSAPAGLSILARRPYGLQRGPNSLSTRLSRSPATLLPRALSPVPVASASSHDNADAADGAAAAHGVDFRCGPSLLWSVRRLSFFIDLRLGTTGVAITPVAAYKCCILTPVAIALEAVAVAVEVEVEMSEVEAVRLEHCASGGAGERLPFGVHTGVE